MNKTEKGLKDLDNSVVIAGWGGVKSIKGPNGNGKKVQLKT